MKALVTGASSGIGQAIAKTLIDLGYEVDGIGRTFETHINGLNEIVLDLTNDAALDKFLSSYKSNDIKILVNCAGMAYYGMHEELSAQAIRTMSKVNLEVPMIITRSLLRHIRTNKGLIINIASVSAKEYAVKGSAYAATKAGLLAFSKNIMAENRKYGVKSVVIVPDMTKTNLYRNGYIDVKEGCCLASEEVARCVQWILESDNVLLEEIVLHAQYQGFIRRK